MTSIRFSLSSWRHAAARTAVVAAAVAGLATGSATAATYLFDFGGNNATSSPDTNGNEWNNIGIGLADTNDGSLVGIVTTTGGASGINFQMVSRFNGVNENGTQNAASLATLGYPLSATRDSFYGNTGAFNNLSNIFPAFKLTGLSALEVYDFTFYASRMSVGDVRTTEYSATGAGIGSAILDAANNETNLITIAGMAADGAGEILINIAPAATNTNAGTQFTYLGVLEVNSRPVPEPTTGAALLLGGLGLAARRRRN